MPNTNLQKLQLIGSRLLLLLPLVRLRTVCPPRRVVGWAAANQHLHFATALYVASTLQLQQPLVKRLLHRPLATLPPQ